MIALRAGGAGDAPFVATLAGEAFAGYGDYDEILPRWLRRRGVRTIVAEVDGAAAGFAMVTVRTGVHLGRPDAELLAVAVAPGARRRGVGTALVREAITAAAAWGLPGIRLHTAETNRAAQRLFASAGFLPARPRRRFYSNGQAAIPMRRRIAQPRRPWWRLG